MAFLVRFGLRTLLAVVLCQLCAALSTHLWFGLTLWLAKATATSQVALDTMGLAVPLAARPVSQAAILLSLPPIFLACWAAAYPVSRRCRAACAGLGAGVLAASAWQTLLSLQSGYVFSLRYALPQPVTGADVLVVALICALEAWVTLRVVPAGVFGRLRDWLRAAGGQSMA